MPNIEDTTAAASQHIRAALDGQLTGPAGHGTIRVGGRVAARSPAPPAIEAQVQSGSLASGPAGHGTIRLGGAVVAGPPDDAMSRAMQEIGAALNGEPTPGCI